MIFTLFLLIIRNLSSSLVMNEAMSVSLGPSTTLALPSSELPRTLSIHNPSSASFSISIDSIPSAVYKNLHFISLSTNSSSVMFQSSDNDVEIWIVCSEGLSMASRVFSIPIPSQIFFSRSEFSENEIYLRKFSMESDQETFIVLAELGSSNTTTEISRVEEFLVNSTFSTPFQRFNNNRFSIFLSNSTELIRVKISEDSPIIITSAYVSDQTIEDIKKLTEDPLLLSFNISSSDSITVPALPTKNASFSLSSFKISSDIFPAMTELGSDFVNLTPSDAFNYSSVYWNLTSTERKVLLVEELATVPIDQSLGPQQFFNLRAQIGGLDFDIGSASLYLSNASLQARFSFWLFLVIFVLLALVMTLLFFIQLFFLQKMQKKLRKSKPTEDPALQKHAQISSLTAKSCQIPGIAIPPSQENETVSLRSTRDGLIKIDLEQPKHTLTPVKSYKEQKDIEDPNDFQVEIPQFDSDREGVSIEPIAMPPIDSDVRSEIIQIPPHISHRSELESMEVERREHEEMNETICQARESNDVQNRDVFVQDDKQSDMYSKYSLADD